MNIKIKKWDIIIICMLLVISFLPYGFFKVFLGNEAAKVYAYITIDGRFYKEIPLTGQKAHKEFKIETPYGSNTLVVEDESIGVLEAECSDQVCRNFGMKNQVGDIIVCLPHSLYIEIKGNGAAEGEMDSRGY